jgi:hypothetical protein
LGGGRSDEREEGMLDGSLEREKKEGKSDKKKQGRNPTAHR